MLKPYPTGLRPCSAAIKTRQLYRTGVPMQPSLPKQMKAPASPKRLLVVDDEPLARDVICQLLAHAGYEVESSASAEEALRTLAVRPIDLVLTDNAMLPTTGLELAELVKARFPTLPVVMFSGNPPQGHIPCVDRVLLKPDDIRQLGEVIREVLEESGK